MLIWSVSPRLKRSADFLKSSAGRTRQAPLRPPRFPGRIERPGDQIAQPIRTSEALPLHTDETCAPSSRAPLIIASETEIVQKGGKGPDPLRRSASERPRPASRRKGRDNGGPLRGTRRGGPMRKRASRISAPRDRSTRDWNLPVPSYGRRI